MDTGNKIIVQKQRQTQRPTAKGLGITTDRPKFPHYAQVSKRRESFLELNWVTSVPVTVDCLVEAGLVYTGVGDSVRCYYCGGGLRNWEKDDDPMVEHARWYPNCPHVALVKGKHYIEKIADGEIPEQDAASPATRTLPDLDILVERPAVQALLEMDYNKELIFTAVRVFTYRTGQDTFTANNLVEIIEELEKDPTMRFKYENTVSSGDSGFESGDDCTSDTDSVEKLEEENETLKRNQNCKICLDKLADIIFLPCGHIMSCAQCAPALESCPVCRKKVSGLVKAYFASIPKSENK